MARCLHPRRPVRAALLSFLALSALIAASFPFIDGLPPLAWPAGFLYCALLPLWVIGVARLGARAFIRFGIVYAVALIPAGIGALAWGAGDGRRLSFELLDLSCWLLVPVGLWGIFLALKGWSLYHGAGPASRSDLDPPFPGEGVPPPPAAGS